jgi:GTP-binding protein EngB required for normal cell division
MFEKEKRRIKRFVRTGNAQARVRQRDASVFAYLSKHGTKTLVFKMDKLGRLRKVGEE